MNYKRIIRHLLLMVIIQSGFICFSQSHTPIPIKIINSKTIVPVIAGNSDTLDIMLDTGMSFDGLLIYNPELSEDIVLNSPIEVQVPGAGSGSPSNALMDTSANFIIGDYEVENQRVLLLQNDIYKGFPTDGILGYSIFGHFAVEIDYDNKLLYLHEYDNLEVDATWESIPLYFKNNTIPWIDVSIVIKDEEPVKISTYIDFAAIHNIELLEKRDMKFSLPDKMKDAYLGRGLSGDIYGKEGKISKLIIGSYELNDVNAAFVPASVRSKQRNADGIIGSGSLSNFNLIFDYKNEMLYIKPNNNYNRKL